MNDRSRVDYSLYLVTDRGLSQGRSLLYIVEQAVKGGVTVVQLREKNCCTREFYELAVAVQALVTQLGVPLIINDRLDIAMACGASGVHVGQDDLECSVVRSLVPGDFIVGVSVSSVEEAVRAQRHGASYLGVSPVFDTLTKTDTPAATGLHGLRSIRDAVTVPLVGIGGINPRNFRDVMVAGADGVAVVSAIMSAPDPMRAAGELRVVSGNGSSY